MKQILAQSRELCVKLAFAILAIVLGARPATAQTCRTAADLRTKADAAVALIARVTGRIEGVPPSDQAFIQAEEKAALEANNRARFRIVSDHRYYAAAKVHIARSAVTSHLSAISSVRSAKDNAMTALEAFDAYAQFTSRMSDYMDADNRRNQPVLSRENRQDLHIDIAFVRHDLLNLARCSVEIVDQRQRND